MKKSDLVAKVTESAGLSKKDADAAVKATFDVIQEAMRAGDKVQLLGFGTFEVQSKPARMGRNPSTGATVQIPASKAVKFKAGKALKEYVNR